ncbi:hypothetical protein [Streptomyces sp. NPDC001809]
MTNDLRNKHRRSVRSEVRRVPWRASQPTARADSRTSVMQRIGDRTGVPACARSFWML